MAERFLREDLATGALSGCESAQSLLAWAERAAVDAPPEAIYRQREGRMTLRLALGSNTFFLKLHTGVGWRELLKNLLRGGLPALDAGREYRAIHSLADAGIAVPRIAAYARADEAPATRRSLLLTDALPGTQSLEQLCADWAFEPPQAAVRHRVILGVANIARRMHGAGWQHRDFYLCHVHVIAASLAHPCPVFYLIDLHRARRRHRLPQRWRVKDLAGLYFSAMRCGLTRRDILRFLRYYSDGGLRAALRHNPRIWRRVQRKASRLYVKTYGVEPSLVNSAQSREPE
ncbi:MAG: lipopolysaccharide core heptose(I) kinase RfaP [Halioglobus sp.]